MSHVTHEGVMSHMYESYHIYLDAATHHVSRDTSYDIKVYVI